MGRFLEVDMWRYGFVLTSFVISFFLVAEHVWGYEPCPLCEWQRYPWYGSFILSLVLLWGFGGRLLIFGEFLLGLLMLIGGSIGVYHAGIEYGFWAGPLTCSSGLPAEGGVDELRSYLLGRETVSCDEASWTLWGVSMAGYNVLVSYGVVGLLLWRWFTRGRV